jgi:serine/threonine protein kinase
VLRLGAEDPYQVGPFRILARLGAGGMGQVYLGLGRHHDLVAVKLIHRTFASDPGFRARFRHEVTAGTRVRAHGTAPVVAADPDAPIPWLATEYVPGPSLDRAVGETGPLAWRPRWSPSTPPVSSTVTSSRRTYCSRATARG